MLILPPVITLSNKSKIDAWHHIFIIKVGLSTNKFSKSQILKFVN
jgi:hypothetical protein